MENLNFYEISITALVAIVFLQIFGIIRTIINALFKKPFDKSFRKQKQLEAFLSIATVGSTFSSGVFYSVFSEYVNVVVFYLDENNILRPDNILLINPEAGIYGELVEDGSRVLIKRSVFINISSYSNRLPLTHHYSFEPYKKNSLTAFYVRERDFSAFKTWWKNHQDLVEKPNSSTFTKTI